MLSRRCPEQGSFSLFVIISYKVIKYWTIRLIGNEYKFIRIIPFPSDIDNFVIYWVVTTHVGAKSSATISDYFLLTNII